jgi:hypothetical protein
MRRPNALHPRHLNPLERRDELCAILALGLLRLRLSKSTAVFEHVGDSSLHYSPGQSGHATPTIRRIV